MNETLKIIIDNLWAKIEFIRSENKNVSTKLTLDNVSTLEELYNNGIDSIDLDDVKLLTDIRRIESEANRLIEEIKNDLIEEYKTKGKLEPHIENMINSINDYNNLLIVLKNMRKKIDSLASPRKVDNGTYYGDIEVDDKIYDPENPDDAVKISESVETATKDFNDINPIEVHTVNEYKNFTRVDIIYDEQIGFRAVANETGRYYGLQKDTSWFIYPSERLILNNMKDVNICNALFKNGSYEEFQLGDELILDDVNPAEIIMPYMKYIDDPMNNVKISEVLVQEGITVKPGFRDENIKQGLIIPEVKNKIIKGEIYTNRKIEQTPEVGLDIINGPTKYIEGTLVPYPREQEKDESDLLYEKYLIEHYKKYKYEIKYDENNKPIFPHLIDKENESAREEVNTAFKILELNDFLEQKYGIRLNKKYELSLIRTYLIAYKLYMKNQKIKHPELQEKIDTKIAETEETIKGIESGRYI